MACYTNTLCNNDLVQTPEGLVGGHSALIRWVLCVCCACAGGVPGQAGSRLARRFHRCLSCSWLVPLLAGPFKPAGPAGGGEKGQVRCLSGLRWSRVHHVFNIYGTCYKLVPDIRARRVGYPQEICGSLR